MILSMIITVLFVLLQVIILDGILSIDNAAALAAIASDLPKNAKTPPSLQWLGRFQRQAALKAGIFGAYAGRTLLLLFASFFITHHWLSLLAAGYLFYLVGTHFFNWKKWEPQFKGLSTFWTTVILIEIADLAFSLDNVAAVVAISSNLLLVIIGVMISIVIMRFAAQLFIKLIAFEPRLEHAAFVLIFAIAVELVLKFFGLPISDALQFSISIGIIAITLCIGRIQSVLAVVRG